MTSETLSNIRPEVFLEIIDRESVRNLVSGDSAYLKQAMAEGKKIHQVTLDRQDQVNNFMMKLCEADLELFTKLYVEEMGASTKIALDEVAAINQNTSEQLMKNAVQQSQASTIISIVIFFVFLISAISIFKR